VGEIRQKGNQSLSWCGAEDGLSDMRGIAVLALRLRGTEPRRSRVVAAEGDRRKFLQRGHFGLEG
jgi:hypothetical protein